MSTLGIVTGLQSEARLALAAALKAGLTARDIDVACAGPGLARADTAAQGLVANGARILLSFGVAGALAAGLPPGAILLPQQVVGPGTEAIATDDVRSQMIFLGLAAALRVERGVLASAADVVMTPAHKAQLARETGAVAVDMESHAVGAVAAQAGLPFAVLRAVADPAERVIPAIALAGMMPTGDISVMKVLSGLARTPSHTFELVRLGRDNARAMASLGRAARLAFPLLLVGR